MIRRQRGGGGQFGDSDLLALARLGWATNKQSAPGVFVPPRHIAGWSAELLKFSFLGRGRCKTDLKFLSCLAEICRRLEIYFFFDAYS